LADLLSDGFQRLEGPTGNHRGCPELRQLAGDRHTDAAPAAGDNGNLSL
jgi:hypothetical protein